MDRASILEDSIDYLKEILQRINDLHKEVEAIPSGPLIQAPTGFDSVIPSPTTLSYRVKEEMCSSSLASPKNQPARVYVAYLGAKPHDDDQRIVDSHHNLLASVVGSKEQASKLMVHSYKHGFSGFSAKLTEAQAKKLAASPDVIHLMQDKSFKTQGTRTPDYLGLSTQLPDNIPSIPKR